MATITETLASMNQTTIDAMTKAHEQILESHRAAAALVAKAPALPSWLAPVTRPLVTDDVLAQAFDFQLEAVEANKRFVLDLAGVWTPPASDD